jgi:hypothetical protein
MIRVIHAHNEPVFVPIYIEYNPIVADEACVSEISLDIAWTTPIRLDRKLIPGSQ